MLPALNIDIKERISEVISQRRWNTSESKAGLAGTWNNSLVLSHVDSEWRRVALRHVWSTVYVDTPRIEAVLPLIRSTHGRYTRKLYVRVQFRSIDTFYRRYTQTDENANLQPFCELSLWPSLVELEVDYVHKCAFPGLAKYLQPRLGGIRVLTISGRVPIDMRRDALFLQSDSLHEICFRAAPTEGDSLSTVSRYPDPILSQKVSSSITHITLTALIDIRIIRWVMSSLALQLKRLEILGLSAEQLLYVGVACADREASWRTPHTWPALESLSIVLSIAPEFSPMVSVCLDASGFPQLRLLCISASITLPLRQAEYSTALSFGQTFARTWPNVVRLELPVLGDRDAKMIAQNVPSLMVIGIQPASATSLAPLPGIRELWHLLTSPLALASISFSHEHSAAYTAPKPEDANSLVDFTTVRKPHPLRLLNTPGILLSASQVRDIRLRCPQLARLDANTAESTDASESKHALPATIQACTPPYYILRQIVDSWV
ncbi:hypothetical protein GQ54DRAFT_125189 [Martensiomyces pterosporus]|nr:hypothetical protein GQ54DRAFT_125189 [Martensiomyces pterosporus]